MPTILTKAQALVQELTALMPTPYQQQSLQALLGLFLAATGSPLPQYCQTKSASALSRFLNQYQWSTRKVIKAVRSAALERILTQPSKGRRPTLQVIIDLTTLEKRGKFKAFDRGVRVYHSKRGLHLVVMYLVVGQWRMPWSFRIYRGKASFRSTDLVRRVQMAGSIVNSLPTSPLGLPSCSHWFHT